MITRQLVSVSALLLAALAAPAQTLQEPGTAFQYFNYGTEKTAGALTGSPVGAQAKAVTGRPLAATEGRRTLQVLGDGTRIERKEINKYFRDTDGRTRTESGDGVTISNPASGSTTEMNTATRTMRQSTFATTVVRQGDFSDAAAGGIGTLSFPEGSIKIVRRAVAATEAKAAKTENLGIQSINGVLADGTRTTITIPIGEIGNDRPINIVNERWFSSAIGLVVKSVNTDPRFGETTYELTDIREGAQDAALFQIPGDYNRSNHFGR